MKFRTVLFLVLHFGLASAQENPATEQRMRDLSEKLRCLVCQNQTLADSPAELAQDLRRQLREQVAAGRSDEQILGYMVQRYGDFVLYEPPFKPTTLLLWVGPFILLAAAAFILVSTLRRRRRQPEEPALSPDDKRLVERVLGPSPPPERDGRAR
ncbi:MAG TPA: cytochrome c-type biogenesis protein [Burkholderiales bacterium]|nr:cytochrome c-type biogenesis protein [Burkholderiales bacterium]